MEKKTVELVVKGEIDINSITIKNIEGGFGENLKCLTINDISEVLDIDIKEANRKINTYRDFFRDGIDIIDLKTGGDLSPVLEMGYTQAQIGNANNIYVLSERGYFKFIKEGC